MKAICINKERNRQNKIIAYELKADNGQIHRLFPDELKTVIRNGSLQVLNLRLTSDNRIIDVKPQQSTVQNQNQKTNKQELFKNMYNMIRKHYPYEVYPLSHNDGAVNYDTNGTIYFCCDYDGEREYDQVEVWINFKDKTMEMCTDTNSSKEVAPEFNEHGLECMINRFLGSEDLYPDANLLSIELKDKLTKANIQVDRCSTPPSGQTDPYEFTYEIWGSTILVKLEHWVNNIESKITVGASIKNRMGIETIEEFKCANMGLASEKIIQIIKTKIIGNKKLDFAKDYAKAQGKKSQF